MKLWRLRNPKTCSQQLETQKSQWYGPVWVWKSEHQESWWQSFSQKARDLRTRKSWFFKFVSKARWSVMYQLSPQARGVPSFLLNWLDDWIRPPHIREGDLFYSIYEFKNVNVIQKHLQRLDQNDVWPNVRAACGWVKLTHKINHHH